MQTSLYINFPDPSSSQKIIQDFGNAFRTEIKEIKTTKLKIALFARKVFLLTIPTAFVGSLVGVGLAVSGISALPLVVMGSAMTISIIAFIIFNRLDGVKKHNTYKSILDDLNRFQNDIQEGKPYQDRIGISINISKNLEIVKKPLNPNLSEKKLINRFEAHFQFFTLFTLRQLIYYKKALDECKTEKMKERLHNSIRLTAMEAQMFCLFTIPDEKAPTNQQKGISFTDFIESNNNAKQLSLRDRIINETTDAEKMKQMLEVLSEHPGKIASYNFCYNVRGGRRLGNKEGSDE